MTLRSTQRFRRGQVDLLHEVERLTVLAHEIPELTIDERIDVVEHVVAFLTEILIPHTEVEQQVLYPEAQRLLEADLGSQDLAQDRRELRSRIAELIATDPGDPGAVQESLYALHVLLALHLEYETELYLRLVQSQPDERVRQLLRRVAALA